MVSEGRLLCENCVFVLCEEILCENCVDLCLWTLFFVCKCAYSVFILLRVNDFCVYTFVGMGVLYAVACVC